MIRSYNPLKLLRFGFFLTFLGMSILSMGQERTTRILFIFDASGSMNEKWGDETLYDLARDILVSRIDSFERAHQHIEFGLRIFGHQSNKSARNCRDSKLEVPFARNNSTRIRNVINNTRAQGYTPIAFSLAESIRDFPNDPNARNIIILITDGLETCGGDPCESAEILRGQNIALNPFVVGIGLGDLVKTFDCVGPYFDAHDRQSFSKALSVVISQAINPTTLQVNLLNHENKNSVTNVEMTFYEKSSGLPMYHFVHSLNHWNLPDTLFINPMLTYRLKIHTLPAVTIDNVRLDPGRNNIIPVQVPQGTLVFRVPGVGSSPGIQAVVRTKNRGEILAVQNANTAQQYLSGNYIVEILSLPRMTKEIRIRPEENFEINIPTPGRLVIENSRPAIASIYSKDQNGHLELIYEFKNLGNREVLELLPGNYTIVYRQHQFKNTESTVSRSFNIRSRAPTTIRF